MAADEAKRIGIRRASAADAENLLAWRNHASIRNASRNPASIDRLEHERWLSTTLADPDRDLIVGEIDGVPVGVVRFDAAGTKAEVSIYLVPDHQRRGLGPGLLAAAETWLLTARPSIRILEAEVMPDNMRSRRLFVGGGYEPAGNRYRKALS